MRVLRYVMSEEAMRWFQGERILNVQRKLAVGFVVLFATLVSACAVGPDYQKPESPKFSAYSAVVAPTKTVESAVAMGESQYFVNAHVERLWWKNFGSIKLDDLIDLALQSSPTMDAARATLEQAEQTYQAQGGASQYPQVTANTGGSRQRINTAAFGQNGGTSTFSLFNAGVNVGYNLDLFGGNRRMLESFAAEADYQRYQLETARLMLIANVMTTAMTQAQLVAQLQAKEQILSAQEAQLNITKERVALGVGSQKEVFVLQTIVEQSRAGIPPLRQSVEQTHHLLSVLVGRAPGNSDTPSFVLADFTLPSQLPVMIPSELVRQRPDVQASEALLQAANARYGAAIAKQYPQINLSADIGSQALSASGLFGAGTLVWGLAGQLTQPLFNQGLPAESRAAKAGFDAALANYRQTVLRALQNVADVLRALDYDASALAAQAAASSAVKGSLELVNQEYTVGTTDYLSVLSAQQQVQQNESNLVAAQSRRLIDSVALYQAMGGGVLRAEQAELNQGNQQIKNVE